MRRLSRSVRPVCPDSVARSVRGVPGRVPTRGDLHPARRPLPGRQRLRRPGPVSPSMRTASRSEMPWGAPRAPPVVRDPPPEARRRRSASRQPPPTRPPRPDQPGRDPVRRAIWPPGTLRPAFTRPSWPDRRAISRPLWPAQPRAAALRQPSATHRCSDQDAIAARPSFMTDVPPSNLAQSRPAARRRPAMQPVSRLRRPLRDPRPCPAPPRSVPAGRPPRGDP